MNEKVKNDKKIKIDQKVKIDQNVKFDECLLFTPPPPPACQWLNWSCNFCMTKKKISIK